MRLHEIIQRAKNEAHSMASKVGELHDATASAVRFLEEVTPGDHLEKVLQKDLDEARRLIKELGAAVAVAQGILDDASKEKSE